MNTLDYMANLHIITRSCSYHASTLIIAANLHGPLMIIAGHEFYDFNSTVIFARIEVKFVLELNMEQW